jgi:hypothetical protein
MSKTSGPHVLSTTSTVTCTGSSTSQRITIISGPVLVGTTGKVAAGVICADGHLGTILSYISGQQIRILVMVPDTLNPTAVQTVLDGNPQNTNPWDVTSTGRAYFLDFGNAAEGPLTVNGVHNVYAVVTFSDNTMARSNVVYFSVNPQLASQEVPGYET